MMAHPWTVSRVASAHLPGTFQNGFCRKYFVEIIAARKLQEKDAERGTCKDFV